MTSLTDTQVVTANGGLVELGYSQLTSSLAFASSSATSPDTVLSSTVVCDGSPVIIEFSCPSVELQGTSFIHFHLWRDGVVRSYNVAVASNADSWNRERSVVFFQFRDTPTAGSHTYSVRAHYSGFGAYTYTSDGSYQYNDGPIWLRVSKVVQATEWPAVTTGTIICTSSTRPASPFEGQKIYQTDDNRELTYDSSAWVQTNSLGGWSTWTPQLYQNGNLTSTILHARYTRIGDTAIVQGRVNATQAGTAGNQIEIRNLPYSAEAAGDYVVIGNAVYWDGTLRWLLHVETLPTATSIAFGYDSAPFAAYGGGRFGQSPSKAVASGHFISFATTYEIA
jgi:hypothetical protein